ncbi:MAG: hypothetical protein KAI47_03370 [Deltaproteobacteria bacterium]|nr:hypothetical protein [Deltaproteobacteria bacterium]
MITRHLRTLAILGWSVAIIPGLMACDDSETPASGDSALHDTQIKPDITRVSCPSTVPDGGAVCSAAQEGLICQYGTDPTCLTAATCKNKAWEVISPPCVGPDPSCPATREAAAGKVCSPKDAYCAYDGLVCDCTNCTKYPVESCQGDLKWKCEAPAGDPNCPKARPLLGTTCPFEDYLCEYGCERDVSRQCKGGVWVKASAPGGCPMSTRRVKKEIHYLDKQAIDRMAQKARSFRLATYRYRDPALRGKRHLGYILEDSPKALSSNLPKGQVDLYSYASMTLALAQHQAREIADLKKKVAALRAHLRRRH